MTRITSFLQNSEENCGNASNAHLLARIELVL